MLPDILKRMKHALKIGGVVYLSFKYGDFEGYRNGRYYIDLTESKLERLLKSAGGMRKIKTWISGDVRADRGGEKWLNAVYRKTK